MQNNFPEPFNIYRHFKGNLYQVIGFAKHTETEEDLVLYTGVHARDNNIIWARPLSMWTEVVEHDGKRVPRFEKTDNMIQCNHCIYYDGVKNVPGSAPCLKHKKMVMWHENCADWDDK